MSVFHRFRNSLAVAAFVVLGSGTGLADDASRWDGDARSAVRLIAGPTPAGSSTAALRAGIEIRLKPGWHTYWRYPGDAGVPPRFDFKGSANLKAAEVRYPAPRRLEEAGGVSIGYDRDLILPLDIVPQDRSKPVVLRLKLDYAICEKLCVPAEGKAELALQAAPPARGSVVGGAGTKAVSRGQSLQDAPLAEAQARIPKRITLGDGGAFAIRSVRRETTGDRPRVVVEVAAPAGAQVELFAEGPTPDWSLPVPEPLASGPAGLRRFTFELDGAPPGAKYEGMLLTLTAVAAAQAIEVSTRLD